MLTAIGPDRIFEGEGLALNPDLLLQPARRPVVRWGGRAIPTPELETPVPVIQTHEREATNVAPTRQYFDHVLPRTPPPTTRSTRWTPPKEKKKLISSEFAFNGSVNYQNLLTSIFSPFIYHSICSLDVKCAKIETFKRRFKITSDILNPVMDLYAKGYKFVLAGGKMIDFFNNVSFEDSTNDYDLWCMGYKEYTKLESYIFENKDTINKGYLIETIIDKKKFQIIEKAYTCVEHVLQSFDIRACAIATDGEYVYWIRNALRDIKEKDLVILNVQPNKGSTLRIQKYIQRGYKLSGPDFALASLSCLLSFDNNSPSVVDFFTKRKLTISQVNDACSMESSGYTMSDNTF